MESWRAFPTDLQLTLPCKRLLHTLPEPTQCVTCLEITHAARREMVAEELDSALAHDLRQRFRAEDGSRAAWRQSRSTQSTRCREVT